MRTVYLVFFLLLLILGLNACKSKKDGYSEHSTGLEYRFYDTNTTGVSPKVGDIVVLSVKFLTADNRLVDESDLYRMQVGIPSYQGDFHTGLQMLQVGDSVSFKLEAADYYENTRKMDMPKQFQQGDFVTIHMRLKNIISASSLESERRGVYHLDEQQEMSLLSDYLIRTNVQVEAKESGMYIVHKKEGSGPFAKAGNTLLVHYSGTTIDGKLFDTSYDKSQPLKFVLGKGEVIKGWDQGFVEMKKGGKAKLIIPSKLAYGKEGFRNSILPYSTLVFDVELIDIQ